MKTMYEYSAGSIIYRINKNEIKSLSVRNTFNRTWGFPKGHFEAGENSMQTVKRKVHEKVELRLNYDFNFKESPTYKITHNRLKTITLFLSEFIPTQKIKLQKGEIGVSRWVDLEEASKCLYYEELNEAQDYTKNEISR